MQRSSNHHQQQQRAQGPLRCGVCCPKSHRLLTAFSFAFVISLSLIVSSLGFAQSYSAGENQYKKGNFKGAESSLGAALKTEKRPTERAKIFKLMGIVQYMQSKQPQAGTSFKQALAANPQTSISPAEVLDESIIPFFNAQRAPAKSAGRSPAPVRAPSKPAAKGPRTVATAQRPAAPNAKAAKTTSIFISSNVPNARITIDGILAGNVGSPIETEAGRITMEISAAGFITKRAAMTVVAGRENKATVNLDKIPPPKPKAAPKREAQALAVGAAAGASSQKLKPKAAKAKGAPDLFLPDPGEEQLAEDAAGGRDLAGEFAMDAATGGYTAMQQPAQPAPVQQQQPQQPQQLPPPSPAQQSMLMTQPQPQPQPAPQPAPQIYAAPPVYAQPQQPMMYPPAYQPPGYGVPVYGAPAYPPAGYGAAPVYMAPPAPPAPPAYDPNGSGYSAGDPGALGPPPPKKKKSKGSVFPKLLPFGIGQYANGSYFLGVLFTASEGYALYHYFSTSQVADATVADTNKVLEERNKTSEGLSGSEKTTWEDETSTFTTQRKDYVAKTRQSAQIGLYAFGGLWVAGVIEAVLHEPDPVKKKKKKRRSGFSLLPQEDGILVASYSPLVRADEMSEDVESPGINSQVEYNLGVKLDRLNRPDGPDAPAMGLSVRWTF